MAQDLSTKNGDGKLLTPEQKLENWETLFAEFRKATPSSPQWYQIADYCIGV